MLLGWRQGWEVEASPMDTRGATTPAILQTLNSNRPLDALSCPYHSHMRVTVTGPLRGTVMTWVKGQATNPHAPAVGRHEASEQVEGIKEEQAPNKPANENRQ